MCFYNIIYIYELLNHIFKLLEFLFEFIIVRECVMKVPVIVGGGKEGRQGEEEEKKEACDEEEGPKTEI